MASALPIFDVFDVHQDGNVATRWHKWIIRLKNLFVAANFEDDKQQRALLLHYGGTELYDIYETLDDTGDDLKTLVEKLTAYFEPKKNKEFEVYKFRQCRQEAAEKIDDYYTRLRQLSRNCEFHDKNIEIKSQIVQCCSSNRLRRKALKSNLTLAELLDEARSLEISEIQAQGIESQIPSVNFVKRNKFRKPVEKSKDRTDHSESFKSNKSCYRCGASWPHDGICPAKHRKCSKCERYGHFSSVCRQGKPFIKKQVVHQVEDEEIAGRNPSVKKVFSHHPPMMNTHFQFRTL